MILEAVSNWLHWNSKSILSVITLRNCPIFYLNCYLFQRKTSVWNMKVRHKWKLSFQLHWTSAALSMNEEIFISSKILLCLVVLGSGWYKLCSLPSKLKWLSFIFNFLGDSNTFCETYLLFCQESGPDNNHLPRKVLSPFLPQKTLNPGTQWRKITSDFYHWSGVERFNCLSICSSCPGLTERPTPGGHLCLLRTSSSWPFSVCLLAQSLSWR